MDALINNAGGVRTRYTETGDGFETQFALNYLSGVLLTRLLLSELIRAGGRVVFTGSNSHMHANVKWNDLMGKRRYNVLTAYKRSKLCCMLFAAEFNRRFKASGMRAYVVDPGLVNTDIGLKNTGGITSLVWGVRKRFGAEPAVAAKTYEYLCCGEDLPDWLYFRGTEKRRHSRQSKNESDAKRLFALSEKLLGISFEDVEV